MSKQDEYCDDAFEWHIPKALSNIQKHKLSFERAKLSVLDEYALISEYEIMGEQRFVSLGMNEFGEICVVGFTMRDEKIRIITAWFADGQKRRLYEQRRYF